MKQAWPTMADAAYYGLAGEIVRTIDPYCEGDPVAVLAHVLVGVGNMVGPKVRAQVLADLHPSRLFAALVGRTSVGRKGLSASVPKALLAAASPEWALRNSSGLSSGEGLIHAVRDEVWTEQPIKERGGQVTGYQQVRTDPGVADKRLMLVESEMSNPLQRAGIGGNTLSGVLRQAWDGETLRTITKNSPLHATGSHISITTHVTEADLVLYMTAVSQANGFGNRWLYFLVKRSKLVADGKPVPEELLQPLVYDLRRVATQPAKLLERTPAAAADWAEIYPSLTTEVPGLTGAMLARNVAQVLRLSVVYAVLDCADAIDVPHLQAAVAVWEYCQASTKLIFGDRLGHPMLDAIVDALKGRGQQTTTDLHNLFGRHKTAEEMEKALTLLSTPPLNRIRKAGFRTGTGRPAEIWEIVP
jgi:Protein of unknown function (DUF3987)